MNRDVIGMSNRSWLKQEIPHWVKEEVITEDAGKKILSRYKRQDSAAYREALFILAAVCIIGGIFFLCASLWSGLDQDQHDRERGRRPDRGLRGQAQHRHRDDNN